MRTSIIVTALFGASVLSQPILQSIHQLLKRGEWKVIKEWNEGSVHYQQFQYVDSAPATPATTPETESKLKAPPAGGNDNNGGNNDKQPSPPAPSPKPAPAPPKTPSPDEDSGASGGGGSCQKASVSGGPAEDWYNDPCSGGKHILESMNEMRAKWIPSLKNSPYTWDNTLAKNAYLTATSPITNVNGHKENEGGAAEMNHKLNQGSYAQVIASGSSGKGSNGLTPFELATQLWLCELPQGNIGCNGPSNGADTGHAEILKSPSYTKIGCYYMDSVKKNLGFAGMYTCDLA